MIDGNKHNNNNNNNNVNNDDDNNNDDDDDDDDDDKVMITIIRMRDILYHIHKMNAQPSETSSGILINERFKSDQKTIIHQHLSLLISSKSQIRLKLQKSKTSCTDEDDDDDFHPCSLNFARFPIQNIFHNLPYKHRQETHLHTKQSMLTKAKTETKQARESPETSHPIYIKLRHLLLANLRDMVGQGVMGIHDLNEGLAVIGLVERRFSSHQHEQDHSETPHIFEHKKKDSRHMKRSRVVLQGVYVRRLIIDQPDDFLCCLK